jgi:hypothetical protein
MPIPDLAYAARGLRRTPAFAAAAVASIALAVAANTAVFSIVSASLLRPLPYRDIERLVILWNRSPGLNIAEDWFSTAQYFDIKNGHKGFEDLAIAIGANYNLTGIGEPERVGVLRVSSNLLPMRALAPCSDACSWPRTTCRAAGVRPSSATRSGRAASAPTRRSSADR